ncbi:MAG TPA: transglutaminase domain-containing protein [Phycisphaerales bacterium]|nr:transglutaminase domain-containing protein [Phycisphaerales bacterium]
MTICNRVRTAVGLMALLAVCGVVGCGGGPGLYDMAMFEQVPPQRYFAKTLNGSCLGYATFAEVADANTICTVETFHDAFSLLGHPMAWQTGEMTVEDRDGTLLWYDSVMTRDGTALWVFPIRHRERKQAVRNPDGTYTFTAVVNGRFYEETFDWPAGALTSPGFRRLQRRAGLEPGTTCSAAVYSIERFGVDLLRTEVGEPIRIDLPGGPTTAIPLTGTVEAGEGTFTYTEYVDEDFRTLKQVTRAGGIEVVQVACDQSFALQARPEVSLESLVAVQSPQSIPYEEATSLIYHLRARQEGGLTLPETDYQRVVSQPDGTVLLWVYRHDKPSGATLPYRGDDPAIRAALEPTELIQSDAELIGDLARRAVGSTTDAGQAARKIESFVNGYVRGDAHVVDSTLFPSALEVAEKRKGVCRHYAVLTAALCRAVGIPAQVVIGYAYTPFHGSMQDVFIAHAWTQAYIGSQWVPLDATRAGWFSGPHTCTVGYIATHISNGERADLANIASSLATFEIIGVASDPAGETVEITRSEAAPDADASWRRPGRDG